MDNPTIRGVATAVERNDDEQAAHDALTDSRRARLSTAALMRQTYNQEIQELSDSVAFLKTALQDPLSTPAGRITGDNNLRGLFSAAFDVRSVQNAAKIISRAIAYYEAQIKFLQDSFIKDISRLAPAPVNTRLTGISGLVAKVTGRGPQAPTDIVKPPFSVSSLREGDTFVSMKGLNKYTLFGNLFGVVDLSKQPRVQNHIFHPGQLIKVIEVLPEKDAIVFEYTSQVRGHSQENVCFFTTKEFLQFVDQATVES